MTLPRVAASPISRAPRTLPRSPAARVPPSDTTHCPVCARGAGRLLPGAGQLGRTPSPAPDSASPSATADATPNTAPTSTAPDASPSPTTAALPISRRYRGWGLFSRSRATVSPCAADPGSHHPLVSEYSISRDEPIEVTKLRDEVRLPAGHVVQAHLGPVVVDDTVWWAVNNVRQEGRDLGRCAGAGGAWLRWRTPNSTFN